MNEKERIPQEWETELDDRQRKELKLACFYATQCNHGTSGHNRLALIYKLACMLDVATMPPGPIFIEQEIEILRPKSIG